MKTQYGFYVETERCIKCWACEVACKSWNGIKAGTIQQRRVVEVTSGKFPDVKRTFVSMACNHCAEPACAAVCPVGAITKRPEDGIVIVDQQKCIGCHSCFLACPFGVPQYGEDGTMQKCDLCVDRLAEGKEPACVATCPTQALHAGPMDEMAELARAKAAKRLVGSTEPSLLLSK